MKMMIMTNGIRVSKVGKLCSFSLQLALNVPLLGLDKYMCM